MEIKSIDFVSTLKWNCINDECLICNNTIGHNCIKCDQKISSTTMDCLSIMNNNNSCKHSFHLHCLSIYLRNNILKCPICNVEWINK